VRAIVCAIVRAIARERSRVAKAEDVTRDRQSGRACV
jgi:hypothetical protein